MLVAQPLSDWEEWRLFYHHVEELEPKNMLEIGMSYGGTLFYAINAGRLKKGKVIGIDIKMQETIELTHKLYDHNRVEFWNDWLGPGQTLILIGGDSRSPDTVQKVKDALSGEQLDYLFIDGEHEMPTPKLDFENYSPLVRKGGIIGFHDIAPVVNPVPNTLSAYWSELRRLVMEKYGSRTACFARSQRGGGIGMIVKEWAEELEPRTVT